MTKGQADLYPHIPKGVLEGTIVYPATDSLPQVVYYLPCAPHEITEGMMAYEMIFTGMRWTQPDLLWTLQKAEKKEVAIEIMHHGRQMYWYGYGKLKSFLLPARFDVHYIKMKQYGYVPLKFILSIDEKQYNINIDIIKQEHGLPRYFYPLPFKD